MRGWRSRQAPSWSPLRLARRSALGHRRWQTLALLAVSALITACTAFAPVYDRAMQQALVDTLLARASPAEKVTVLSDATIDAGGAEEARDPRELRELVPGEVAARLEPSVLGRTAIVTPTAGDVPPSGPLVWREGACEHLRLLSGSCPEAPGEILVSEDDVSNFGLSLGSTPTVRPAEDEEKGVRLEVVGTYAPSDATWWQGLKLVGLSSIFRGGTDPSATHDGWLTTEETFVEAPVLTGETSQSGALVATATAGVDEVLALGDRVRELARDLRRTDADLHVDSDLEALNEDVRAQTRQAHRTVPLLMAPMAVLTLFALWLVLAAATEQRRGEVAVARLRGRGPRGAAVLLLFELLPVLLVGVALGAGAALLGGTVARVLLPGAAPFEAGPGFVAAVGLAVVAVVVTTVAAAVRVAREPLDSLVRGGRLSSGRWALGPFDAFLIAGLGTGVLAFATGSLTGPFALAGPALLALLAGFLLAHLAAPTAGTAGRRLLRQGRLVSGVTLLETGRRRETRAVIAVLTVAVALGVFAVNALVLGERNRTNASEYDAGAPVVLRVDGRDLDGVRAAVSATEPTGRRATTVVVSGDTLAVQPDEFRQVAFFPRGAPTDAQWRAIAPPDREPVELTGSRFSITVRSSDDLTAKDSLGSDSEARLGLAVTTSTGLRRTIQLGALPPPGRRTTLDARDAACADGCRLAALEFTSYLGVGVEGTVDLSDLRVDGRPTDLGASAADWNATEEAFTFIRPSSAPSGDALRLLLSMRNEYPVELTSAWVPKTVPALLPAGREDPLDLVVTGIDGVDRPASSAGRIDLIPAMPSRSALVDLDALSRGAELTFDAHAEVWLDDDPELVEAVSASLRDRGIAVADVRRYSTIRTSYDDTIPTWSLALGAVLGPAVILTALLILLVLAVTGWRDRARDLAILRLNGAGGRTVRRLAGWAQLPAVLLGVVTGVGAGLVGAALAMPDVAFFATAPEAPVVDLATSWPAVLGVAAACVVLLPAAAALLGLTVARRAHPERVKENL